MARSIPVVHAEQQLAEVEAALRALRNAQPFRGQMDLIRDVEAFLAHLQGIDRRHTSAGGSRRDQQPDLDA
jgi:hypothetical protein